MDNLMFLVQTIIGFAALGAGFKGSDWLISLKYMTKDECVFCRGKVEEKQNAELERLVRMETKMDMMLGCVSVNNKE